MQQASTVNETNASDQVSLGELLLKIGGWFNYLLKKWWIIVIAGIIGGSIGFTYAFLQKKEYIGRLTFILEDSKSGGLGAYSGLASQFGLDLGGGGTIGLFQGDNINEFLRSRLMVQRVLLSYADINQKNQTLADHFLDIYKWREKWNDRKELSNIHFDTIQNKPRTILQDSVLNLIYKDITKQRLNIGRPDKKLSFIEVQCITLNEYFSKYFVERLVNEALRFYIEAKTKKSKANVDRIQRQADSILGILNYKTYTAAPSQDINVNPTKRIGMVQTEIATRDKTVLMTVYAEILKNLGIAKMALAQDTPIIQIIDTPILPLEYTKLGKLKVAIMGAFLSGFLMILYLSLRQIIQKAKV